MLIQEKNIRTKEENEVEIIKDLPEVFEEFAEQRKKSFLAIKEVKDQGFRLWVLTVHIFQKK